MSLLKSTFPTKEVLPDEPTQTATEAYEQKAKESIGGSMVFVERAKLHYDPLSGTPEPDNTNRGSPSQ